MILKANGMRKTEKLGYPKFNGGHFDRRFKYRKAGGNMSRNYLWIVKYYIRINKDKRFDIIDNNGRTKNE